jgi:adhesin HecA-like repeat protein
MAISNKHKYVSGKADGGDTSLVRPSNWNDEHDLTMATARILGRTTAGTGAVEELTAGTGLTLSAGSLSVTAGTYAAAGDIIGQQTIWVPAGAMTPTTTNGAASGSFETTTNDVMLKYLAFDATTREKAQFGIQMPKSWDESTTIIAQFVWTHPSTTTNFGVSWELAAVAFANDDAADTAFGTLQEIDDTGGTTYDIYISDETPAITVAGSPAAEEYVIFEVTRDPADAGDTMAVDAWLLGVKIHYTTNAAKDD